MIIEQDFVANYLENWNCLVIWLSIIKLKQYHSINIRRDEKTFSK